MARIFEFVIIWLALMMQITYIQGLALHRKPRLTLLEPNPSYYHYRNIGGQAGTYSFGYDVVDPRSGTSQYRSEERFANGTVKGSYGFVDDSGQPHSYNYIADERGYRVSNIPLYRPAAKPARFQIELTTEPEITWTRPKRPPKKSFINTQNKNIFGND